MATSINLVPQEEVTEQTKSKLVRFSTVFSVILLVVVSSIGAYLTYQRNTLKQEIESLDTQVQTLRSEINSLSSIEITARNLDKKFTVISEVLDTRVYFSLLAEELRARTPESIRINNFNVREEQIDLSGQGTDYISVATFMNNLLDKEFSGGNEKLKSVFTGVTLNSVSLKGKDGGVDFVIVVSFDPKVLKR